MMTDPTQRCRDTDDQTGLGLIEVVVAVLVFSIGVLAAAGVSLSIGSQARLARWDTDRAVAARSTLEGLGQAGYASAASGRALLVLGQRAYQVTRTVTLLAPRLKHVRVTVTPPAGRAPAIIETRLARPRPLPSAS